MSYIGDADVNFSSQPTNVFGSRPHLAGLEAGMSSDFTDVQKARGFQQGAGVPQGEDSYSRKYTSMQA